MPIILRKMTRKMKESLKARRKRAKVRRSMTRKSQSKFRLKSWSRKNWQKPKSLPRLQRMFRRQLAQSNQPFRSWIIV